MQPAPGIHVRSGSTRFPARAGGLRGSDRLLIAALVGVSVGCGSARGHASAPQPVEPASASALASAASGGGCALADSAQAVPEVENADVAIVAHVHAQRVRVDRREGVAVSFPGRGARDTVSCVVRSNLPHPLQPGRTYRDVDLTLRILTRFDTTQTATQSTDSTTRRPPAAGRAQTPVPGARP